jgi:hypothetical protein
MPGPSRPMASSQGAVEHGRDPRPSDARPPRRTKPRAERRPANQCAPPAHHHSAPSTRKRQQRRVTPSARGARRRAPAGRSAPRRPTLDGSPPGPDRPMSRPGSRLRRSVRGAIFFFTPRADRRSAQPVGGLRAGAGAPTDAGSERPAGREGDRRAEQRGLAYLLTYLLAAWRSFFQSVRALPPHGSRVAAARTAK